MSQSTLRAVAPHRHEPPSEHPAPRLRAPLPAADQHLVRRFTWGHSVDLVNQVRAAGSGRAWLERQLAPDTVADPWGTAIDGWFPLLRRTPEQLFAAQRDGALGPWDVEADLGRWTTARRVHSTRQVEEVVVAVWSELFDVSGHPDATPWRVDHDRVLRRHALGRFSDLLHAAATHPASRLALGDGLGRAVLERWTAGPGAGWTVADAGAVARVLAGYRATTWWPGFRAWYDEASYDAAPVRVLGFRHEGGTADGRAMARACLDHLAAHPTTARRLADLLCRRFVSESPSPSIVEAVLRAYLRHGTSIRHAIRAMVSHPDFGAAALRQERCPGEDWVATVRALGLRMRRPTDHDSLASVAHRASLAGRSPHEVHHDLAGRWWATHDVSLPAEATLLPAAMPCPLQDLVDHLALRLVGQRPGLAVSRDVAAALGWSLDRTVTRAEVLGESWRLRLLQAALLDSPLHRLR